MEKKVLFIISSLASGGAERTVSNLTRKFNSDWDIDILLNETDTIAYPFRGNIISLGLRAKKNKLNIFYQFKVFIKRYRKLRKLKKCGNYDACISFMESANFANILTGKKKTKVIVSVRNNLSKSANSLIYKYIVNPMCKWIYKKADKIVVVAKGVEEDLVSNFNIRREQIETIYNGYDLGMIDQQRKKEFSEEEKEIYKSNKVVILVGRLEKQKAQWQMIKAMPMILNKVPDARLIILGEGRLRENLMDLANKCHVTDKVYFLGQKKNPYKYLNKAQLYVMPSLFEGFPNALVEAMACEIPCIAADCKSGPREILAPNTNMLNVLENDIEYAKYGVLVPVAKRKEFETNIALTEEEQLLATAVINILNNPKIANKYKINARIRAEELKIDESVQQWEKLIEK